MMKLLGKTVFNSLDVGLRRDRRQRLVTSVLIVSLLVELWIVEWSRPAGRPEYYHLIIL